MQHLRILFEASSKNIKEISSGFFLSPINQVKEICFRYVDLFCLWWFLSWQLFLPSPSLLILQLLSFPVVWKLKDWLSTFIIQASLQRLWRIVWSTDLFSQVILKTINRFPLVFFTLEISLREFLLCYLGSFKLLKFMVWLSLHL